MVVRSEHHRHFQMSKNSFGYLEEADSERQDPLCELCQCVDSLRQPAQRSMP